MSGTVTNGGDGETLGVGLVVGVGVGDSPDATASATMLCCFACAPPAGCWDTTVPCGALAASSTLETRKPAPRSARVAVPSARPSTSGPSGLWNDDGLVHSCLGCVPAR